MQFQPLRQAVGACNVSMPQYFDNQQGLGTDCEAAAIGRFIPSLGQSEASIFAMRE